MSTVFFIYITSTIFQFTLIILYIVFMITTTVVLFTVLELISYCIIIFFMIYNRK